MTEAVICLSVTCQGLSLLKIQKGSLSGMLLASGSLYKEYTLVREAGAVLMAEERALPSILVKCLDPGLMEVLTDSRRLR